ncbi:hypothetical protein TNIN_139611 [Trichonephila inaurata madagascariensis]|uniref:RING-type domain-containing protein n=1 Tax=Trichonephila inaurata madagascariensis TaxID=2747483 RepID=A0A8X7CMR5_9ARAC|nr:hypothetical protein TNIN_139611 [Trichonephila inaurata madagascariensis]
MGFWVLKPKTFLSFPKSLETADHYRTPHGGSCGADATCYQTLPPGTFLRSSLLHTLNHSDVFDEYLEQESTKGKGAFIEAVWIGIGKPKLYNLVHRAWAEHGPQTLAPWMKLAQIVLDGCYVQKCPDSVFQVPDSCPICLTPIHWPQRMQCGHVFHTRCLSQHLDIYTTCPICRASLRDP